MTSFSDNLRELIGQYPFSDGFIEAARQRVIRECSKVPVHIHKRTQAQNRLELAAKEAIVLHFDEAFADAWFPFTLRPGWPLAHCIIHKNVATVEFSFGPETDGERGGQEIEPVQFPVQRVKANIITRTARKIFARKAGEDRETHLPPVGQPEMVLTQAVPAARPTPRPLKAADGKPVSAAKPAQNPIPRKAVTAPTPAPPAQKPGSGKLRAK